MTSKIEIILTDSATGRDVLFRLPNNINKYKKLITKVNDKCFIVNKTCVENGRIALLSYMYTSLPEAVAACINKENINLIKNVCVDAGDYYIMRLTQNKYTLIDKADYEYVDKLIWHNVHKHSDFANSTIRINELSNDILLHNYLMGFTNNIVDRRTVPHCHVIHINGDNLDNRRDNLVYGYHKDGFIVKLPMPE